MYKKLIAVELDTKGRMSKKDFMKNCSVMHNVQKMNIRVYIKDEKYMHF